MILFIAEIDKEKESHLPCARHELAVIVKEVKSVNNRTVENKLKRVKVHALNCKSTAYCIELNGFLTRVRYIKFTLKMQALFFPLFA